MLLKINGLNKATLLVELFNNAKKSDQTTQTIKKRLFPGKMMLTESEQEQLNTLLEKLNLSPQQAEELIRANPKFEFISSVYIGIDLSGDSFDSTEYDKTNAHQKTAAQILTQLNTQHATTHSSNKTSPVKEQLFLASQKLNSFLGLPCKLDLSFFGQLFITFSSKVTIDKVKEKTDLLKLRNIISKAPFSQKFPLMNSHVKIILQETLDSLLSKMDTVPLVTQGEALLCSKRVAKDKILTLIFDIDSTLAFPCLTSGVRERDKQYVRDKGALLQACGEEYFIYPGVIELIKYLSTKPYIQIAFFSAGYEIRNQQLINELLKIALGNNYDHQFKNPIKILSRSDLTQSNKINRQLSFFMYHQLPERYNKDIQKVINKGDLKNTILIDDNPGVACLDQMANLLICPSGPQNFQALEQVNYNADEDCPHQFNSIFYLAGVLSCCIAAFEMGRNVNQLLLNLQYKPCTSSGVYEPRKNTFSNQYYYRKGLEVLKTVNPNISFVTSLDYEQCTANYKCNSEQNFLMTPH